MINREEFAQEMKLRENIRKAIRAVKNRRQKLQLQEQKNDNQLRNLIRDLLIEAQTAVTATAKHASTGINSLEDLLKNSNILSVLEVGYKSLTTDPIQRTSYRNHILVAVEKALAPEESTKEAGDTEVEVEETEEVGGALAEDIDIDVGIPEDDPDFIDVEEKEVKSDGEIEKEEFAIEGEDLTGRNKAYTDFQSIQKVILRAYDDLDNPEDLNMFEEYLIKNLALYFDKYEAELKGDIEEPAAAAAAELGGPGTAEDEGVPGEEEIETDLELQEVLKHLDIDDIIENLL